jgi:hypothetical protein
MVNVFEYISKIPQFLTAKTTELLTNQGFTVSDRWTSGVFLLISLILFYLGIVIVKPIVKWALIILSLILIVGILVPFW